MQFAEVANNDFLRFCMTEIVDAAVKEGKTKVWVTAASCMSSKKVAGALV